MIKLAVTAVWICLITLGSVYVSIKASSETSAEAPPADFFGGLDYVRGEVVSIPVISDGAVHGYFLARLVFTAEPEQLARLSIDPQVLITDQLYTHLVGNKTIDFANIESFDLTTFRTGIRDALNERVGEKVFHEIIIEQVDYLTKEEIRSNMQRGGTPVAAPPSAPAEQSASH
ncbi:hypothetical protein [Pararhizobium haloflavum]|uniref:hypothetical protein n=1 Tax=Pararhizobium haloflavum TaxID=2037914 RepID=UPI0018E40528|nr:hypothetical protein [Pararhizobium haloflavum]